MGVAGLFKKIKNIAKTVVNKVKNFGDKVVNTVANNSTLNKLVEVGGKVFKGIGQAAKMLSIPLSFVPGGSAISNLVGTAANMTGNALQKLDEKADRRAEEMRYETKSRKPKNVLESKPEVVAPNVGGLSSIGPIITKLNTNKFGEKYHNPYAEPNTRNRNILQEQIINNNPQLVKGFKQSKTFFHSPSGVVNTTTL